MLVGFLLGVIAGARRFAHLNQLRANRALQAMARLKQLPCDDTILNYFWRFSQAEIGRFWRPLRRWLIDYPGSQTALAWIWTRRFLRVMAPTNKEPLEVINPRRPARLSHHPLLAVLAEAPTLFCTLKCRRSIMLNQLKPDAR